MPIKFGAQSEYGKLRRVLMHRPTEENKKITPGNKDAYLFRDVVYWKEFQKEHDTFSDLLRNEGIQVTMLNDLLDEDQARIADTLPNLVYTRDVCMVSNLGAHALRMTYAARQTEPLLIEQAMKKLGVPLAQSITPPATVEGGDFVWLDKDTLLMGFVTRSNEAGVNMIREKLMGEGAIKELVAIPLPNWRVHLDGGLMVMSPDIALYHEGSLGLWPSYVYNEEGVKLQYLRDYLEGKGVELIEGNDTEVRIFGTNIVDLGDHKCVSYEWNERLIEVLDDRGFDVLTIPGSQLSIGGGGPHCMTCPILRDS